MNALTQRLRLIPVLPAYVAVYFLFLYLPILLLLSVVVAVLTVVPGRAKPLNGGVHLVLLAAYVFLSINP